MKRNKFTWSDAIAEVLKRHGYVASLKTLYQEAIPIYSQHNEIKGLTPHKTIDERVQRDKKRFVKILPGIYALTDKLNELPKNLNPNTQTSEEKEKQTHAAIQAMLLQLGNFNHYKTYTPDVSKKHINQTLSNFASLQDFPKFTYERIINRVRMIDVS